MAKGDVPVKHRKKGFEAYEISNGDKVYAGLTPDFEKAKEYCQMVKEEQGIDCVVVDSRNRAKHLFDTRRK